MQGNLQQHTQEVCGLKWSPDGRYLASGGNDNVLNIWAGNMTSYTTDSQPLFTFTDHQAAVKALAWCPWQSSLLASGGGTADRCVKFWSCSLGTCLNTIDTKSQVCNNHFKFEKGINFNSSTLFLIWILGLRDVMVDKLQRIHYRTRFCE